MKLLDLQKLSLNESWVETPLSDLKQFSGTSQKEVMKKILKWAVESFTDQNTKNEKELIKTLDALSDDDAKNIVKSMLNIIDSSLHEADSGGNYFGLICMGFPRYGANKVFIAAKDQLRWLNQAREIGCLSFPELDEAFNALKVLDALDGKFQKLAVAVYTFSNTCERILTLLGNESVNERKKHLTRLKKVLSV